jgi:hypothetical protein
VRPPEKTFDTSCVIKADTLRTRIDREVEKGSPLTDIATISKVCSSSTLQRTARRIASFHRSQKIDFKSKFGLPAQSLLKAQNEEV